MDTSKSVHSWLCPSSGPGRTERDATSWSKGRLRELLVGITVENEAGRCEISELKQVEGEASCSSRKGKLIFFYEWNIKLGWKGNGPPGTGRVECNVGGAELVDSLFIQQIRLTHSFSRYFYFGLH